MASKFFAADNDFSSNPSDDEVSDNEEEQNQVIKNRYYESSSDEEEKRVVRSEKDKRYDALRKIISRIKDKMRIEDFVSIRDEFDELNKQMEKSKKVIEKEGVPIFYIRICYVLDNFVKNITSEQKKAFKPANNKAYNALKQNLRKNNKAYEAKLEEFGKNPIYSDEEADEEEEEAENKDKPKKTAAELEDESDWSDPDDEDEDDEDQDVKKYLLSNDPMIRRKYWLKRTDTGKVVTELTEEEKKVEEEKRKNYLREKEAEREAKLKKLEEQLGKGKKKKVNYALTEMDKRMQEVVERRGGRKAAQKEKFTVEDDLDVLTRFYEDSGKDDLIKRLEILLNLIPTRSEFSKQFSQYLMPRNFWTENFENLQEYFKILKKKNGVLENVRTFHKDGDEFYKPE